MAVSGFRIDFEEDAGYLYARVERLVPYKFETVMSAIEYVAAEARRRNNARVLWETVRGLDETPDSDQYQFVRRFAEIAQHIERLAFASPSARAGAFIEDISANRGFEARVFSARAEAAAWLTA